jgi:dTDP-4-dehydrorhamnose reductase
VESIAYRFETGAFPSSPGLSAPMGQRGERVEIKTCQSRFRHTRTFAPLTRNHRMFLIVGADSQIGAAAFHRLAGTGAAVAGTTRRSGSVDTARHWLDLARPLGDWPVPVGTEAACVCAAVPRLAACAADPAGSAHVNVGQSLALIERLIERDIYVLFLSTNQVFDGRTAHAAPETPPAPISEYGRQKVLVEAALRSHLRRGAPIGILRLSRVISPGIALLRGWVEALTARRPIRAFADMMMAPVPLDLVATSIERMMRARANGIYQLSGPQDVSYAEVGNHIANRVGAGPELVEPVPAAYAGLPAGSTPRHTTMESSLLRNGFGIRAPEPWQVIESVISGTVD